MGALACERWGLEQFCLEISSTRNNVPVEPVGCSRPVYGAFGAWLTFRKPSLHPFPLGIWTNRKHDSS